MSATYKNGKNKKKNQNNKCYGKKPKGIVSMQAADEISYDGEKKNSRI